MEPGVVWVPVLLPQPTTKLNTITGPTRDEEKVMRSSYTLKFATGTEGTESGIKGPSRLSKIRLRACTGMLDDKPGLRIEGGRRPEYLKQTFGISRALVLIVNCNGE